MGGEKLYTCLPLSCCVISTVAHSDVICAVDIVGVKCQLATLQMSYHCEWKKGGEQLALEQLGGCRLFATSLAVSA